MLCSKRVRWGDLGGLLERGGYYKNQPLNGGGGGWEGSGEGGLIELFLME